MLQSSDDKFNDTVDNATALVHNAASSKLHFCELYFSLLVIFFIFQLLYNNDMPCYFNFPEMSSDKFKVNDDTPFNDKSKEIELLERFKEFE